MSKAAELYAEAQRRAQAALVPALLLAAVLRHAAHGERYDGCECEVCSLRREKYYTNLYPARTGPFVTKKRYINHIKHLIVKKMQQGIID
jgi:hypothetical protein